MNLDLCGVTRLLVPAFVVGLLVATFAGSDALGAIAAAATVMALVVIERVRGTNRSCAIPIERSPVRDDRVADDPARNQTVER